MPKSLGKTSKKKKYNSRFPPARIKKIMQTDEDVGKVAAAVPVIISRALELFIESLISETSKTTVARNAKTLSTSHIKHTIHTNKQFDFLRDLVAAVPDHATEESNGDTATVRNGDLPQKKPRGRPRKNFNEATTVKKKVGESSKSTPHTSGDEDEEEDEETESNDEDEDNDDDDDDGKARKGAKALQMLSKAHSGPPAGYPSTAPLNSELKTASAKNGTARIEAPPSVSPASSQPRLGYEPHHLYPQQGQQQPMVSMPPPPPHHHLHYLPPSPIQYHQSPYPASQALVGLMPHTLPNSPIPHMYSPAGLPYTHHPELQHPPQPAACQSHQDQPMNLSMSASMPPVALPSHPSLAGSAYRGPLATSSRDDDYDS